MVSAALSYLGLTMEIHERIRKYRELRGLTQENMGMELAIDPVNYGRIERGKTKLTIDRLERIAQILGVELDELLGLASYQSEADLEVLRMVERLSEQVGGIAKTQQRLLDRFEELSQQLARLKTQIEALK